MWCSTLNGHCVDGVDDVGRYVFIVVKIMAMQLGTEFEFELGAEDADIMSLGSREK